VEHRSDRDRLVVDHLWLARSLAARYRDRGESSEDLEQVAALALVRAADGFRPEEGNGFAAYAVPSITGELRKHFRDKGWDVRPPRRLQELRWRLRGTEQELTHELMRMPTTVELAQRLGVEPREVDLARQASAGYSAVSLDAPAAGRATTSWADVLADEDEEVAAEDAIALRPLLSTLCDRDQRIIALRFYRGLTQQQIADDVGVTQMQVSRLLSRALLRLRAALDGAEPALHQAS
jgi:RNA polymerase sigma-B factor